MNVITNNPIIEDMSNCCGNSSADGMPTAGRCMNPNCPYARKGIPCPYRMKGMACGYGRRRQIRGVQMAKDDLAGRPVIIQEKSGFDDYSNFEESLSLPKRPITSLNLGISTPDVLSAQAPLIPATPKTEAKTVGQVTKDFLSGQKTARRENRSKVASDVLLSAETRAKTRQGAKESRRAERLSNKEARQLERISNRKDRAKRRTDRKAKKNAEKLKLIQKTRNSEPKFFLPLQKLRLGKKGGYTKTYPDGTVAEVAATKTITDANGNVYSASDVSKATNIPEQALQGQTLTNAGVQDPTTGQTFGLTATTNSQGQTTLGIEVNDANVSGAMDGQAYLASDVQGSSEPTKDVKADDENKAEGTGMSKTQKWVLGIGAAVVVGLVVYALVKNKKSPAGAASSTGGATLSKVA